MTTNEQMFEDLHELACVAVDEIKKKGDNEEQILLAIADGIEDVQDGLTDEIRARLRDLAGQMEGIGGKACAAYQTELLRVAELP